MNNRSASLFLVALIIAFLGCTLIILNSANMSITGFATNETTGQVNLSVLSSVSISLTDAAIDFGTCDISGRAYTYVNSSAANTSHHNQYCNGTSAWTANGDNITLRNDGNVAANITVKTSTNSTNFFTSADDPGVSWYKYWTQNASTTPGCAGDLNANTLFADTTTEYNACNNLSIGDPNPGILMYIEANITQTVTSTSDTLTLTFTAYEA